MPVDAEKLLRFNIPEVRQTLTRRDTALYALSVGFGQDPMDERQLRYVDPKGDLVALPSMPIVLGHPGFWLSHPESGVDPTRVVHGEQELVLHGPAPVEGELIGRTRITGLTDKGAGQAALLYSQKELVDAATGKLLATTYNTTFVRGGGGFGGGTAPARPSHATPEGAAPTVVDLQTRPEQALYYRLNGDYNPLHSDPKFAKAGGFPRPILHGLCTLGVICHALVRVLANYEPNRMQGLSLRFSSPVYPGESIRTEIWPDGSFRARVVERDVVVATNGHAAMSA